jgi:rhodanese-related sulfurtransferase
MDFKVKVLVFLNLLILTVVNLEASTNITPDKLQLWINGDSVFNFILVDLRDLTPNDTVIATETCRPYNLSWYADTFKQSLCKIPRNTSVILYCLSGSRSALAASMMTDSGFTDIYTLSGGIRNWNKPAKPVAYIKSNLDLPAFSMQSTALSKKTNISVQSSNLRVIGINRMVTVGQQIKTKHSLMICNLQGKTLYLASNPFSKSISFYLPKKFNDGVFLLKLRVMGGLQSSVVFN